jgi:DNA-binding response OmpR family regulator
LPHGSYIRLTITDSGEGMTEEVQRHIFEPFFTTKPMGKGTGLGLSTVYGIVRRSNGWIYVDSHPGKGSTFTILMPEAARHPQDQSPSSRHPVGILGDESVLLIEDSEEVRRLTALHLKALGYAVIEAATGEDAIAIADQRGGEFDLVLADVMLPGKSGFDAARQIQARFPHVAVLFFSGYAGDTAAGQGPVEAAGLLPKPFTPEELGGRIRAALRKARNQIRIIVADDEAGIRELLRDFLSSEGYLVETARDGKEVLDQFAAGAVDLFLMDLVMPVKEGIETIIELRRRTPATPIIAMSGAFGGEFLNTAQILGARATLLKPISKPLLLKTVRDVLCAQRSASTSHPN